MNTPHMKHIIFILVYLIGYILPASVFAEPTQAQLAVWVNEAIITTYTFDFEHFVAQEKEIATYFTANGWMSYSQAMQRSKLPTTIQTNSYYVSAVATMPPTITMKSPTTWEAVMPILVIYKNPTYQQKQTLLVTLQFIKTPTAGVRGLAISSLKSSVSVPPCQCVKTDSSATIV